MKNVLKNEYFDKFQHIVLDYNNTVCMQYTFFFISNSIFGLSLGLLSIGYSFSLKVPQQLLIYTNISLESLISCLFFQLFNSKVAIYFRQVFLIFGTLGLRFLAKMDMDLMVSKNMSKYYLPVFVSRSLVGCGGIHFLFFIRTIL